MKIIWAGTGAAFAPAGIWQCQAVVVSDTGKKLLIDCGGDARHSLAGVGLAAKDVDGVYVSHLHGDHVHGLEWLAFNRYGWGGAIVERPKLYGVATVLTKLWSTVLRGTLESVEGRVNGFADYFDLKPVDQNESFTWEGILFEPVQTVHVMNGRALTESFGVLVTDERGVKVFFTTDTQHCPSQIQAFYNAADYIFHDCETTPYKSGVHAHYTELVTLPKEVRQKIFLIHYQAGSQYHVSEAAVNDGFRGFIKPGFTLDLTSNTEAEEARR